VDRDFAGARFAAGFRAGAGFRVVDAGLAPCDAGLRVGERFVVDLGRFADSSSPVGCSPVPGSREESTVKPYQSAAVPHSSITKRQHQLISSQMSSLFR
jgi:hypothetical protein